MGAATALTWPMVGRGAELDRVVADLARPEVRVVHLVGEAGTGKSRLAAEVLRAAELDGYPVARTTATASGATVPLAALSPVLPEQLPDEDPTALFGRAAAHVREIGDGARLVLAVDDVDALDTVSCALLARLLDDDLVVLLATQREGTPTPDVVLAQHRSGGGVRIEVGNLPRTSTSTLLHRVLEGPLSAAAEHLIWSATEGNPLYLRELVAHGVATGSLVRAEGVWVAEGDLGVPGGLAGIVAARLAGLDPDESTVVDLLALCAPVGVDDLAATVPLEVLERLEASGVVTLTTSSRRQEMSLAHPLHGKVVRDAMPRLRARRLLLDQATRVEQHGARRRDDLLRLAVWRLDATGTADAGLLVQAARQARTAHDYPLVERLSRAAILLEPDVRAAILLGEALYELGRFEESESVLAEARTAGADDEDAVRLAILHAITLFFGLARTEDALDRLESEPASGDGEGASALAAMRALLLTQAARSQEALAVLTATPPTDPALRAVHDRARAWALHRTGEPAPAAELALDAYDRETSGPPFEGLLHPAGHLVVAALAQLELGDPAAARATAALGRDAAVAQGVHFQAAWLAWTVATVDLVTGFAEDAAAGLTEIAATSARAGFAQVERMACQGMSEARALAGDADGAAQWLARAEELPEAPPAFHPQLVLARAWTAYARGEAARGAAALREAATELAERGELRDAAMLADEVVLFGERGATDWADGILALLDTPVTRARRMRVQAIRSGSADDLLAAAEAFAECDFVHSAALLCAQAAEVLRASGEGRAATAAEVRGRGYAERSPGLVVVGLGETSAPVALTPREREVAGLAARGRSSKEIAAALVLSVRTVDNHLANVYTKLGVSSRGELAGVMGIGPSEEREPR